MKHLILLVIIYVLFSGCDVQGYLVVQNCSSKNAQYITYFKSQNNIIDTVALEIPVNETKGMLMGFGFSWTDECINQYISEIDKLEIIVENDTTVISESDQMISYFRAKRKRLFKRRMKIKIP